MAPPIIEHVWCVRRPQRSASTSCRCPPTFMPVEALWRWLREDVTYHHCHSTADDLSRRVAAFEDRLNQDTCTVADRLWVKDHLDPDEEKLRFSRWTRFRSRPFVVFLATPLGRSPRRA